VYPVEHPLHNKETVEIRAMTAREEDILTSKALIKKGTVISELLRSCIIDKSIDPDMMLTGDRNALMVALRITGYGADYQTEVQCPACGARCKNTFNLGELPIKEITCSPVAEGSNAFEFMLPRSKIPVRYKLLTGADERELAKISERQKKQGAVADNLITNRFAYQLISVNSITDKNKIRTFIRNMPAMDSRGLRKQMDLAEPGIDMAADIECPSCGERSEVRMPLGANFFWPDTE
jgi:predicted RNA-binding Zn-ribbon protein involved in translation (DUF1610 family)